MFMMMASAVCCDPRHGTRASGTDAAPADSSIIFASRTAISGWEPHESFTDHRLVFVL